MLNSCRAMINSTTLLWIRRNSKPLQISTLQNNDIQKILARKESRDIVEQNENEKPTNKCNPHH